MPEAPYTIRLPARIGLDNANQVLENLARELAGRPDAVLELASCADFDSALVAVLLDLMRRGQASGVRLHLQSPSANLLKLAALYGAQEILFDDRN